MGCILLVSGRAQREDPVELEHRVKAAFLYNLTQFVTWPETAFPVGEEPLRLGLIGEDPFGAILDETMKGKFWGARPITVVRLKRGDSAKSCQMLFISRSEAERVAPVLAELGNRPVLTVSDMERFAENGGIIALEKPQAKICLAVNLEAARKAGLTISARLLSLKSVRVLKLGSAPAGGVL
jgi:hypothetical protein